MNLLFRASRKLALCLSTTLLVTGIVLAAAPAAGASSSPKPLISSFAATPTNISNGDGWVTLTVRVANASTCTFTSTKAIAGLPATVSCASGQADTVFDVPLNSGKHTAKYSFKVSATGPGGTKKGKIIKVTVNPGSGGTPGPLSGVVSVTDGGSGYCALLTTTGVDCWGDQAYVSSFGYSDVPIAIPDTSGTGTLTGVQTIVSDHQGYCAIMDSTEVDCWGVDGSDVTPAPVPAVGGTGDLTGVRQLVSDHGQSYCALLTSGGVDCWGTNSDGELGNGTFAETYSGTPTAVTGVEGSGTLSGVQSLAPGYYSYCAVMSPDGGLDCWGFNQQGELGIGSEGGPDSCIFYCSTSPVEVDGGGLTGVVQVASTGDGGTAGSWCALLNDSSVTCWGWDNGGGSSSYFYPSDPEPGSSVTGVSSLVGTLNDLGQYASYCGITSGGAVTCWRDGENGELGNALSVNPATSGYGAGETYFPPVSVVGVGGSGTLTGVSSMTDGGYSFCATLTSGGVDCWGLNASGELGIGTDTGPDGCSFGSDVPCSTTPQEVLGLGGSGLLSGVKMVTSNGNSAYCAVLTSGGVDCWGNSGNGNLGDGTLTSSSSPSQVLAPLS